MRDRLLSKSEKVRADTKIRLANMIEADRIELMIKGTDIAADTKILLANMDDVDRIELMRKVQLDIVQLETDSQISLEHTKYENL